MDYKPVYKSTEGRKAVLEVYESYLSKWPVDYEEITVVTRYGNTYMIVCGDVGLPPMILLHGTNSNLTMWIGEIADYAKHFRVYSIDIPGEPGKSEEKQYPLNSPAYHQWMEDVLNALSLKKAIIAGISLGGWMAVNFSVRYPERVEKLVLLCPSGIGPQRISFLLKAFPFMFQGDKGLENISKLVFGNQPVLDDAINYSVLISKNFYLRTFVPIFADDHLKRLTMPVLLFAGDQDVLLDSKKTVARVKKLLPHAETHLLPGVGHVLIHLKEDIISFLTK
jgi:pimeloyl-ACP methyl ester carboxylesterase